MAFEVEHEDHIVIVADYDEKSGDVVIEDVVDPNTGEIVTDDWFDTEKIRDEKLREKIIEQSRQNSINNFL